MITIILAIAIPNSPSTGENAYAANSNNAVPHQTKNGPNAVLNTNLATFFMLQIISY